MDIDNHKYSQLVKSASKNTKTYKTLPAAFIVGGLICAIGEALRLFFLSMNLDTITASAWVSVILILATAILTGVGLFDNIAKVAGAGSFVPITGFANSIVSPALEFKTEGFILGMAAKMFVIAGPVIVYGTTASIVFGIIYYLIKLWGVMS